MTTPFEPFAGLGTPAYGGELSARELVDALRARVRELETEVDRQREEIVFLRADVADRRGKGRRP